MTDGALTGAPPQPLRTDHPGRPSALPLATVRDRLIEAEEAHDLFSRRLFGVYYWSLLRTELASELWEKRLESGKGGARGGRAAVRRLWTEMQLLPVSLGGLVTLLVRGSPARDAVLTHRRKINIDGAVIDRLTRFVVRSTAPDPVLVLDRARKGWGRSSAFTSGVPHVLPVEAIYIVAKYTAVALTWLVLRHPEYRRMVSLFPDLLSPRLQRAYAARIARFIVERRLLALMLARTRVERLVLTVGHAQRSIIAAAQACGIHVIEYQHGPIGPYNLAYTVARPDVVVPYSPDTLRVFGPYWCQATCFPANLSVEVDPRVVLRDSPAPQKTPGTVLFVSQAAIGFALAEVAEGLARRRPDLTVVYRAHPNDRASAERVAEWGLSNLRIDTHQTVEEAQRPAEFQVGVYSTALFAGFALGCRTVLVRLPGLLQMEPIIANGDVLVVDTAEELAARLEEAAVPRGAERYGCPWR